MEGSHKENEFRIDSLNLVFGKCLCKDQSESLLPLQSLLNVPFRHPPDCPLEHIYYNKSKSELQEIESQYDDLVKNKGKRVKFASVGIIVDKNDNVLLTRRNQNLRIFPRSWVFPGGQVDKDESFLTALLRELSEEVGVQIQIEGENYSSSEGKYIYKNKNSSTAPVTITPILLYESSYPYTSSSPPQIVTSQILVVYYKVKIELENEEIYLTIQTDEVDGYLWLQIPLIKQILYPENLDSEIEFTITGQVYDKDKGEFIPCSFNNSNFNKKGTEETIPYGHYLACGYL